MESIIEIRHQVVRIKAPFDRFTHNIEAALVPLDWELMEHVVQEPDRVKEQLERTNNGHAFLFLMVDHGALLAIGGVPHKARLYAFGNPLLLLKMTKLDMRAGLYGPMHLLVYEAADQQVYAEYDLPTSLFGQFGNPEVTKVAEVITGKIAALLDAADQ
ncbi:MAG: DUF302 domain-containing protein [Janthinobacterium lividum]